MTVLDLCSYLGLGAAGAVAVNLLIGLLIAFRYSPSRLWPHRRINLFALHQWTAYAAVALTLTHPAVLLFMSQPHFRPIDILSPVQSPIQPMVNLSALLSTHLP